MKNVWITLVILIAIAIRVLIAMNNPLWMDEIFGVELVRDLNSFIEIIFSKHEGNHILNSIYLYAVQDSNSWLVFRLHSIFFSILSLLLLLKITNNKESALLAIILFSSSLFMNVYATEIRGYSLLLFFGLATWYFYKRLLVEPTFRDYMFFSLCCMLGILSHAAFVMLLGAICLANITNIKLLFGISLTYIFSLLYYFSFISGNQTVALPYQSVFTTYTNFFSLLMGGARISQFSLLHNLSVYITAAAGFSLLILALKYQKNMKLKITMLLMLFVLPLAIFTFYSQTILVSRYLIIAAAIYYIWAAEIYKINRYARILVILLIVSNLIATTSFYFNGRGKAPYILAELKTLDSDLRIGGDYDPRITRIYSFYKKSLDLDRFTYVKNVQETGEQVDFILSHHVDPYFDSPKIWEKNGNSYELIRVYPAEKLSSFSWYVYQRQISNN